MAGTRHPIRTKDDLARLTDLSRNLLRRDLRSRYKRSTLGWTWSLVNPLASVVIYTMVFSVILRAPVPEGDPSGMQSFPLFLLCALVPWNLFANAVTSSTGALVTNASMIRQVYFPREALVLAVVASVTTTSLIEMSVLAVILLIAGNFVLPWLPVVALLLAIEVVFVTGVALAFSIVNVYLRDVQYLVTIALQFLFYATPIVYPTDLIPEHQEFLGVDVPLRTLLALNPLAVLTEMFRDVLYDLRWPALTDVLYLSVWAAGLVLIGAAVFRRFEPRLAEEL